MARKKSSTSEKTDKVLKSSQNSKSKAKRNDSIEKINKKENGFNVKLNIKSEILELKESIDNLVYVMKNLYDIFSSASEEMYEEHDLHFERVSPIVSKLDELLVQNKFLLEIIKSLLEEIKEIKIREKDLEKEVESLSLLQDLKELKEVREDDVETIDEFNIDQSKDDNDSFHHKDSFKQIDKIYNHKDKDNKFINDKNMHLNSTNKQKNEGLNKNVTETNLNKNHKANLSFKDIEQLEKKIFEEMGKK